MESIARAPSATNSLCQFCNDSHQKREELRYSTTETDDA